ncbi:MAG: hypothetical protein JNK15_25925 [Planctomycetes bacterium]|nr:hypothetical protein [Planctomycetota bacterium]
MANLTPTGHRAAICIEANGASKMPGGAVLQLPHDVAMPIADAKAAPPYAVQLANS